MKALILFFSILLVNAFATIESGNEKAEALRELSQQFENGVIQFNATGFRYFIMEMPRPYDVVVFFTASNCKFCDEMQSEYEKVSQFYKESGALNPYKSENDQKRATFFSVASFNDDFRSIFFDFEFKSVPNILVSLPKTAQISAEERSTYIKNYKWSITHTDGVVTSHKFLEYVNQRTGRDVQHSTPMVNVLTGIAILFLAFFALVAIYVIFRSFWLNTKVWFFAGSLIYIICAAGFIYNIIHGVPFTTTDKNGNMEWIAKGQRSQLGAEGFVMSTSIVVAGWLFILWTKLVKWSYLTGNGLLLRIAYLIVFLAVYGVVTFVETTYAGKGFYNPLFYPPAHYQTGSIMNDQGNSL